MDFKLKDRLKELRKSRGLTQDELSQKIGIKRNRYGNFEAGINEPNIDVLRKLSLFYGVSVDYIIGLRDDLNFNLFMCEFNKKSENKQKAVIEVIKNM